MSTPDDLPVIDIRGLSKRYGRLAAVRHLDLQVRRGEIFGFLGLNGAGKTTTIRILLDLLRPTAGSASVFGHDCRAHGLAVRASLGYLPGELSLYADMTGRHVLDLLDHLAAHRAAPGYRRALCDRFSLSEADLDRRLREYSAGMKRKVGLVQAFQSDPPLLILDEPTEGLDPLMQEAFYDLLGEVRRRGHTVFMSSHVLSEVGRVCDRIGLLREGGLVLVAPVDDVRRLAPRRVRVTFDGDVPAPDAGTPGPGISLADAQPRTWTFDVRGPLGPLVARLSSMPVVDVQVEEPRLEDVIISYYREGGR
jgi:ABC-2 type transport system ATP-binding protein